MGNTKQPLVNDSGQQIEICFTGFKKEDKNRLTTLAQQHNMLVRQSVTVNLDFLCGGYNAGPAKKRKAEAQGVIYLTEETLLIMLKTGELIIG
ncbi:MAG: BRCT domain-containing protein [Endozoicomonadaceae bacterium]|nr:BRCT domain-containing protein [Endozoicomonadaceae bacterium]